MTKILVIEDELHLLSNILELLRIEGYEAAGAENGIRGIALAYEYEPDLIVCDIMMPGRNGYEVLLELQASPLLSAVPFLFLTARANQPDMRKGMILGADDYITKPFSSEDLLSAIKTRLDKHIKVENRYKEQINEIRSVIAYSFPHELRTPLTGILGYAEYMLNDFASIEHDQVFRMIERIYGSGMRLYRLIENYLLYVELEFAPSTPEHIAILQKYAAKQPANPGALVELIVAEKAKAFKRADDIDIEIENQPVAISEDDFKKIITELIDNALRFSEPGKLVKVNGQVVNGTYELTVCDQGRGMEPEEIAAIGPYRQFKRDIYEQQGLGLGLYITKKLLERYGGSLVIVSHPHDLTVFTCLLPCAPPANE